MLLLDVVVGIRQQNGVAGLSTGLDDPGYDTGGNAVPNVADDDGDRSGAPRRHGPGQLTCPLFLLHGWLESAQRRGTDG